MPTLWTTEPGPDPALRQVFAADRPAAVATAVVGGSDVLVTLTDEHEDFDCQLGDLHHERCPEPGMRIWDRATGDLIRAVHDVCDNGTDQAMLVTVVVDGRPLAVVRDLARPPKVVDLETGRRVGVLPGHEEALDVQDIAIAVTADGPVVVTAGWDGVLRATAMTGGRTTTVDVGERSNAVAVVHLGGRPVAVTGRDALTLWDVADGTPAGVLELVDGQVPAAIVSWPAGDSRIAVLGTDGTIAVWDAGTGSRRIIAGGLALLPWSIAAVTAADGRPLLGIGDAETVTLWDVDADTPFGAPLDGPVSWARTSAGGPGILLACSPADDAISVWRLDGERPPPGSGRRTGIRCLAVTPDGEIVAGHSDGVLSRWRLDDGARRPDLGSLPGRVNAVAAVADGEQTYLLAVGGELHATKDDMLHRWAGGQPLPATALEHRGQGDLALTFHLDGEPAVLTTGCDGRIHLTGVRTGLRLGTITDDYPPRGVAVGLLAGRPTAAICGMFGPFTLRDLATGTAIATPAAADVRIGESARGWIDTGDGPTVITVHDFLVRMHNLHTGAVRQLEPGHDVPVTALAVTDEPARAVAVAIARVDGSASVVDAATGRNIRRLTLPFPARAMSWGPAGRLILACRRDLHCVEIDRDR